MNPPRWLASLVLVGVALGAPAPARADAAYDACMDAPDGTNTAWAACGGQWLARGDARLNGAWQRLSTALDAFGADLPDGRTRADLLAEQRAWIAYKEASCLFYANGDWGREGQVLHFIRCRADVIATRTRELEQYVGFVRPQ